MPADRPNIVIVLCDQLRRQALSCAGDPNVDTPTIDGLADEGVRFTNACSTYPICVPTRLTFVTGEYAHTRHAHHRWKMSPAERTFAHELADAGCHTAYVGHWYLANLNANLPIPKSHRGGFETWRGFDNHRGEDTLFETRYYVDDEPEPRALDGYHTDGLFDLGVDVLDEHDGDRPLCLVISVVPPHPPYTPPEEYRDRWADRSLDLRPNVPYGDPDALPSSYESWGSLENATDDLYEDHSYNGRVLLDDLRGYYGMIENIDDNVRWFMDALEDRGIRDETAVLFTSDHGDLQGSHGHIEKQHPYEESVGIPFVLSHPDGGIDGGRTIDDPIATEDWYPTILGLAGLEAPGKPGENLVSLARGDVDGLDREGVLLEFVREIRPNAAYHEETWRGFRTERFKYTVKGDPASGAEPWQLFDLEADPYERENLIDDPDMKSIAERLHGLLRGRLDQTDDDIALAPAFSQEGLNRPPS